jgi:hypothetical protein
MILLLCLITHSLFVNVGQSLEAFVAAITIRSTTLVKMPPTHAIFRVRFQMLSHLVSLQKSGTANAESLRVVIQARAQQAPVVLQIVQLRLEAL